MKLLPFERYDIESEKSIDELCTSIDHDYEPWKFSFSFGATDKPLIGRRQGNEFKLYRAIRYRNSFLPIAIGKIIKVDGNSIIKITLRMNVFVMIFMMFWLSFPVISAIKIASSGQEATMLIPAGMFVFGYLLMQAGFWFEVPKIRKLIYETISKNS